MKIAGLWIDSDAFGTKVLVRELTTKTVQDDGGNIHEAYESILIGGERAARRTPSDAEPERAQDAQPPRVQVWLLPAHHAREQLTCERSDGLLGGSLHRVLMLSGINNTLE